MLGGEEFGGWLEDAAGGKLESCETEKLKF